MICVSDVGYGYGHNKDGRLDTYAPKGDFTLRTCLLECYRYKVAHNDDVNGVNFLHQSNECFCERNTVKYVDVNNSDFVHFRIYPFRMEL